MVRRVNNAEMKEFLVNQMQHWPQSKLLQFAQHAYMEKLAKRKHSEILAQFYNITEGAEK